MKEKTWGTWLIILGILGAVIGGTVKIIVDYQIRTDNVVCTDCMSYMTYMIIWFICGLIVAVGVLLRRSEDLQERIKESQLKINKEFKKTKREARKKEEFQKFLEDYSKDEVEVIEFLHTYEGIKLQVLQERVSFSKAKLRRILNKLEENNTVTMMPNSQKLYLSRMSK